MNDDTLTLYFYKDGLTPAERRDVQSALDNDAELRERYARITTTLAQFDVTDSAPLPADMLARFHDSIDRAARSEQQRASKLPPQTRWSPFAWGSAVAAALVLGIGIGLFAQRDQVPAPGINTGIVTIYPPAPRATSVAFERGLQVYLRDSQQELSGQPMNTERSAIALQLIRQNRLFERAAEEHNSKDLARVLRAFEPILLRLAADDISEREAEALQAQLAFELKVMLTKLGRNLSEETGPI